jgi:hypothetical protein
MTTSALVALAVFSWAWAIAADRKKEKQKIDDQTSNWAISSAALFNIYLTKSEKKIFYPIIIFTFFAALILAGILKSQR